MAPEQLEGRRPTAAADLHALGVVLFEMVTGRLPFSADTSLATALQRLQRPAPSPRQDAKHLERHWEAAIQAFLEVKPERRPASAALVWALLSGAQLPPRRASRSLLAAPPVVLVGLAVFASLPSWRQIQPTLNPEAELRQYRNAAWGLQCRAVIEAGRGNRAQALEAALELERYARESPFETLPVALVFARLGDEEKAMEWLEEGFRRQDSSVLYANRRHFLALAPAAMRKLLVDHARARLALKRGGGARRVPLEQELVLTSDDPDTLLALEAALVRLEERDARLCRVVELRFVAGLTEAQIAAVLGLAERTVRREWEVARAFLSGQMRGLEGASSAASGPAN